MGWLTPQLFIGTILTILGAQVSLILALYASQRRYIDSEVKHLTDRLEHSPSNQGSGGLLEDAKEMKISIVEPRDWKHGKPKRRKNKGYTISPIHGMASGPIKSAFLAVRHTPNGDLRIGGRLTIKDNGAWSGSAKIPSWDQRQDYEVVAVALPANLDLSHGVRIHTVEGIVTSNPVPVRLEYEEQDES